MASVASTWRSANLETGIVTRESGGGKALGGDPDDRLADMPLHTFTLKYNFLRDGFPWRDPLEWTTLAGFFLALQGNLGRFLFKWGDDFQARSQNIGTTDGSTLVWTLTRTWGCGEYSGTEPIGWLDLIGRVIAANPIQRGTSQRSDDHS
jgi:hypothetical protein